jgi:hypothetical protein
MNKSESSFPPSFSDEQLAQIFRAAAPLNPAERVAFLEDLANMIRTNNYQGPLGDGLVYRAVREVQRRHFDPPDFSVAGAPRKWER